MRKTRFDAPTRYHISERIELVSRLKRRRGAGGAEPILNASVTTSARRFERVAGAAAGAAAAPNQAIVLGYARGVPVERLRAWPPPRRGDGASSAGRGESGGGLRAPQQPSPRSLTGAGDRGAFASCSTYLSYR